MANRKNLKSSDVTNAECGIAADVSNAALPLRDSRRQSEIPESARAESFGSPSDSRSSLSCNVADVTNAACSGKVKSSRAVAAMLQIRSDETPDVTNAVRSC